MTTNTDTEWTNRLASIMPDNFLTNIADSFSAGTGILNTMINRIGRTVVHSVDNPYNPFSKYTKSNMDYGDTIQEYKVKFINGAEFIPDPDPQEDTINPYVPVKNTPIAQYSKYNDATQYKQTIFDDQLKLAFTGQEQFGNFVAAQLDTMYQSDALDKFIKWKKYISDTANIGFAKNTTADDDTKSEYGEELLKTFKEYVTKFKLPSKSYNKSQDMALSGEVDIIMRAQDKNLIDTDVLSGVYNLDKVDIKANFIYIDDFATPSTLPTGITASSELVAVIADSRAYSYTPRTSQGGGLYNPENLYTNYWYTVQGIYSVAKFRNIMQLYKPPQSE